MTVGPLLVAVGTLLMTRIDAGATYVGAVLPAVLVTGPRAGHHGGAR